MRAILSATALLGLLLCSCNRPLENAASHIVHSGEQARLVKSPRNPACLALSKADAHLIAQSVDQGNEAVLRQMIQSGRAIEVDPETEVLVQHESFNERGVLITSGPQKDKQGWVPYEWLAVRQISR